MATPFIWGPGGQAISTPEAAQRQRAIAEALMAQAQTPAQNWAEGLADVTGALSGSLINNRVSQAEEQGRIGAAEALAGLSPQSGFGDIATALSNPWLSGPQSTVAAALLQQNLAAQDPMRQIQLEQAQLELERMRNPPPPTPDYGFTFAPDGTLIRTDTTSGTFDPMGSFPKPETPLVQVNTGDNSGAFIKKGDELAAQRLSDVISAGQGAQQMMGDIQALTAIGSQINTGKTAEIMNVLGPYAQALGVEIEGLGEGQAYQAIIDRMAPQMRPAGSGASSDFDARQFLSSLPQLGRTAEGNQIITETLTALQHHKIAAAEIAAQAFNGQMTWQEAEDEIRKLGDPYTAFNEYKNRVGGSTAAPGGITIRKISD